MKRFKVSLITILAIAMTACGSGEQLTAFKNLELCGNKSLGNFIENESLSYEWQHDSVDPHGEIVGFVADFQKYNDGSVSRIGFQATYKKSSLDSEVWEFYPAGFEMMNKQSGAHSRPPLSQAFNVISSFCSRYKQLTSEEQIAQKVIEPALDDAKRITSMVDWCMANKSMKRLPSKDECKNEYVDHNSNDPGITEINTPDYSASYSEAGEVIVTFSNNEFKGNKIIYMMVEYTASHGNMANQWGCSSDLDSVFKPDSCQ